MTEVSGIELQVPEGLEGGIWSNMVVVSHSQYEFTLDFTRIHFAQPPVDGKRRAVLVQRVNVSPLLVTQLIGALQKNMARFERSFGERIADALGDDLDGIDDPEIEQ